MTLFIFFILTVCAITVYCEDGVFDLKHNRNDLQFDLTNFEELQTVNLSDSIKIKFKGISCGGFRSKVCLIKHNKIEIDIGSKINEVKLDAKNQFFMSLEGTTFCEENKKFTTDITFVCDRKENQNKIVIKSVLNNCKYNLELISITSCPIDDIDIRKVCSVLPLMPKSFYRFNLNPLRRLTSNYLVKNQNRQFELNICGRLVNTINCGNITTICDITDINKPKVSAVGFSSNDKLFYDLESQGLKLIQHEKASRNKNKKGRSIEIIFKCNEAIPPEKTKPEFISEANFTKNNPHNNLYFEVATSLVCIPRIALCELMSDNDRFNLKPLHKRVGNIIVPNEKSGGYFYLNICSYLNQYNEEIPASCTGKTSACYVDSKGKGVSIGSTQIGPNYTGNSILLNYTDGVNCNGSIKWSTIINLTCSDQSLLSYDSTNSLLCTHVFQWKSHSACTTLFEKKNQCMVTHPQLTGTSFNLNSLKNQSFDYEINDYEDNTQFRISICRPLQTSCNGNFDSAVCWLINGIEINVALFTEEVVFDNGKIYMYMQGEQCDKDGPSSLTTIQFVCDYSDSKNIIIKKDIHECIFEFIIYTKYVCTKPSKMNCTVDDESGNMYDLSKLTKLDSNYEITIGSSEKIILNVCHSVINYNIDGIDCQFHSGICLVNNNYLLISDRFKNLGDVINNKSLRKVGDKIILEMNNGLYDGKSVSSIIEFACSNQTTGPFFLKEEDNKLIFSWYTPLVCQTRVQKNIRDQIANNRIMSINPILINGLNYTTYLCPKNDINCNFVESNSNGQTNSGRTVILTVNGKIMKYILLQNSYFYYFVHDSNNPCNEKEYNTVKIIFHFICGYELQILELEWTSCVIKVRIIDPKICSQKLECNVNWYNLTPLKGNYIVENKSEKYFINMCMPGVGGVMEFNGKNYSIGYQIDSPKHEVSDSTDIIFKFGDYCLGKKNLPKMYSSVIRLECDPTESKGYPIYLAKSKDKCELKFLWRTNLVCHRKLVEFNMLTCTAYIKDFLNNNIIDMKNILNTNQFYDSSTNMVYHVDFCNKSVCLNNTKCISGMDLEYDVSINQFIARFKEFNNDLRLNIKIACPMPSEKLSMARFSITNEGVQEINTYSKDICCMDFYNTKEICKKNTHTHLYFIPQTSTLIPHTTTFKTTNVEYKSSIKSIYNMEKEVSLFNFSVVILLILLVGLLIWFYRWKLLKEVRKLLFSSSSIRRRRRSHSSLISIN